MSFEKKYWRAPVHTSPERSPQRKRENDGAGREQAVLEVRGALMRAIGEYIDLQGLTQKEAAELLGVSQPRVSEIVKGKVELFAVDRLISMLDRIGLRLDVRLVENGLAGNGVGKKRPSDRGQLK